MLAIITYWFCFLTRKLTAHFVYGILDLCSRLTFSFCQSLVRDALEAETLIKFNIFTAHKFSFLNCRNSRGNTPARYVRKCSPKIHVLTF